MTRQLEVDLPWTQRALISWRFSLQRRKRKLLLHALLPAYVVLIIVVVLSVTGWRLLSAVPSAGGSGQELTALRQLRVVIPVAGAFTVFTTLYVQVQNMRRSTSMIACLDEYLALCLSNLIWLPACCRYAGSSDLSVSRLQNSLLCQITGGSWHTSMLFSAT